jgi:hypothetical protein
LKFFYLIKPPILRQITIIKTPKYLICSMKLPRILNQLLVSVDIFKLQPFLLISKKRSLSSPFSQFLSMLFFLYLFYNLYLQFHLRINFQNQQILNQDIFIGNNASLKIQGDFMMGLRIYDAKKRQDLDNYF